MIVPQPLAPPNELARRYERARRDATTMLESLVFGGPPRAEDVIDALEMSLLWRLVVSGDLRHPTQETWDLMREATNP